MTTEQTIPAITVTRVFNVTPTHPDDIPQCSRHRKRLKFFCTMHRLLLCSVCAVKTHRGCEEVLTIHEAVEEKKAEGKKVLGIYDQRIAIIETAITERRASKKLLETNVQEIQSEIHGVTEKIIDLLKAEERSLYQTLRSLQTSETDSVDKDLSTLEATCSKVKDAHDSLSENMKTNEIDLIHAVIKEQQDIEDTTFDMDSVVKKNFRDVDLKFLVSPHIQSFLKHFRVLGQVMMSEDQGRGVHQHFGNTRSVSVSDLTRPTRRRNNAASDTSEESQISVRARWSRDRYPQGQRQAQREGQPQFERNSPSPYPQHDPHPANFPPSGRLRRSETPDLSHRSLTPQPRRDFTVRPQSIPVDMQIAKAKDLDKFPHTYKYVKAQPVDFPDRNSTVRYDSEPVRVIAHSGTTADRDESSNMERPIRIRPKSPFQATDMNISVVRIKDDPTFGRSFAAVQVADPRGSSSDEASTRPRMGVQASALPQRDVPRMNGDGSADPSYDGSPGVRRRPKVRMGSGEKTTDQSRAISPAMNAASAAEDDKERRWIHKYAFSTNEIGTKRLISGIGCLNDGRLIIVDQEHYSVQLFDRTYSFLYEIKLDSRPFDVAVLSDNKIVISLQSERVLKFFLVTGDTLTPVADLGVPCDLVCYGLCRGGGHYCVCCGEEILVLSDQGRLVSRLKTDPTTGKALFSGAEYATMDLTGSVVYVSDAGSDKLIAVQIDGKKLWEYVGPGFQPSGLKFMDHYIYVSDKGHHRIMLFNMDGEVVTQSVVGRLENPCAISFSAPGNVMYATQMRYDSIVSPARPVHVFELHYTD